MAKVGLVHNNFTAGELSPKMLGRVDTARYLAGVELMENAWPDVHGGFRKRWGTLFHSAAKIADRRARLIPFVFSRSQAYILEFGHLYMRVHIDTGVILSAPSTPFEIVTPYTEDMLAAMDWTQAADTMILWHPQAHPRRLRRLADDRWVLDLAPFNPAPFDENGTHPATSMTLSDPTVGAGRTLTVGGSAFFNSDVGRQIWAGLGTATITGYVNASQVTVDISEAFDATSYAAGDWRLTASPQCACTPSATGPVGAVIDLDLPNSVTVGVEGQKAITGISASGFIGTFTITVTVPGHGYVSGNSVQIRGVTPTAYNGTYSVNVVNSSTITYTLGRNPGAATTLGTAARVTSTSSSTDGWRAEDVGKHVRINDGLVRITEYVNPNKVRGVVLDDLNTTVAAQANAWTLNGSAWNDFDGYPATGTFHMQRLLAAGSPGYPQTVWGSAIGEFYGFQLGVNDDDAFQFEIAADDLSPITYLSSMDALMALTFGGEFTLEGGVEKPITPTNIRVKPRSNHGCQQVRPVRVGGEEFFVQRSGKALRAASYDNDTGKWAVPDMTVLADHLMTAGVLSMSWHQTPGSLLMAARADGVLLTSTFDRDQDVVGWARQTFDGAVEAVATIPTAEGDRTWVIVRRTIGGATVRYIEKFDEDTYTDSAIKGTHPTGTNVWTGLGHLEGKQVAILADGVPQPPQTVAGGQITLPRQATAVEFGLPIRMRVKLLPPEVPNSGGVAQGNAMRTGQMFIRVLETVGLTVNGQVVPFRQLGPGVLDAPVAPFTGLKQVEQLGWERGASDVEITHDDPLPCQVLQVIRKFTWNEG